MIHRNRLLVPYKGPTSSLRNREVSGVWGTSRSRTRVLSRPSDTFILSSEKVGSRVPPRLSGWSGWDWVRWKGRPTWTSPLREQPGSVSLPGVKVPMTEPTS